MTDEIEIEIQDKKPKKRRGIVLKIFGAIFICLILIGGAAFIRAVWFVGHINIQMAEAGDPLAQYYVGANYLKWIDGVEISEEVRDKFMQKSADQGFEKAQFAIAVKLFISRDFEKYAEYMRKYSEQNIHNYGSTLKGDLGFIVNGDLGKMNDHIRIVHAASTLCIMNYDGFGIKQNYAEAFRWCSRSVELGETKRKPMIGAMYLWGNGVEKDEAKGLAILKKESDADNAVAAYELGRAYLYGVGVKQDYTQAVQWLQKAVDKDDRDAQVSLGRVYQLGWGVQKNDEKAFQLFQKASSNLSPKGEYQLGLAYLNGQGVQQNTKVGVQWIYKSAIDGYDIARYALGLIYDEGKVIPQDKAQAIIWYRKAAAQGNTDAAAKLREAGIQ